MLTAGVMTCGGIEFKTKGRDDQAECENVGPDRCKTFLDQVQIQPLYCSLFSYPGKAAGVLKIDAFQMIKAFCKPRIKVGTEWVTKGQTW